MADNNGCGKSIDGWNRCGVKEMGASIQYCAECDSKVSKRFNLNSVDKFTIFIPSDNDVKIHNGDKIELSDSCTCKVMSVSVGSDGKTLECIPVTAPGCFK